MAASTNPRTGLGKSGSHSQGQKQKIHIPCHRVAAGVRKDLEGELSTRDIYLSSPCIPRMLLEESL